MNMCQVKGSMSIANCTDGPDLTHLHVVQRIMGIKYSFPPHLHLSRECVDIIAKIFVGNPANRITVDGIRSHPWFLKNLPDELRVSPALAL